MKTHMLVRQRASLSHWKVGVAVVVPMVFFLSCSQVLPRDDAALAVAINLGGAPENLSGIRFQIVHTGTDDAVFLENVRKEDSEDVRLEVRIPRGAYDVRATACAGFQEVSGVEECIPLDDCSDALVEGISVASGEIVQVRAEEGLIFHCLGDGKPGADGKIVANVVFNQAPSFLGSPSIVESGVCSTKICVRAADLQRDNLIEFEWHSELSIDSTPVTVEGAGSESVWEGCAEFRATAAVPVAEAEVIAYDTFPDGTRIQDVLREGVVSTATQDITISLPNCSATDLGAVIPLGDSITFGGFGNSPVNVPGGYRQPLYQKLLEAGFSFDFVGTSTSNSEGMEDPEHAGFPGLRVDELDRVLGSQGRFAPNWVLLHIGTNDANQNFQLAEIDTRLKGLLTSVYNQWPQAHVLLSTISPLGFGGDIVNQAVRQVAEQEQADGRRLSLVEEMGAALDQTDLADGTHPNATGYEKMAEVWFQAILNATGVTLD